MNLMRSPERRIRLVFALLSALPLAGCSRASTSVSAPTAAKCQISVGNVPTTPFPPTGGSGSVSISTARDCTWSVSAENNWIAATPTTGQGSATVSFTVQPNSVPSVRTSALVISSQRVPLSQAAAPCHFDLSRRADIIAAAGGQLSVGITTLSGCSWTASSQAAWMSIRSGASGTASGTVVFSVAANDGGQRVGTATVGGQSYTVTQDAANGPSPPPPPGPAPTPTQVQLTGTVRNLFGQCPNLAFTVSGRAVVTTSDTEFSKMRCRDTKNGLAVIVDGTVASNAVVVATRVRKDD